MVFCLLFHLEKGTLHVGLRIIVLVFISDHKKERKEEGRNLKMERNEGRKGKMDGQEGS